MQLPGVAKEWIEIRILFAPSVWFWFELARNCFPEHKPQAFARASLIVRECPPRL